MAKYTVVSMPGDGIGNQVLPEAIRVLNAVGFDAEYVHGRLVPFARELARSGLVVLTPARKP